MDPLIRCRSGLVQLRAKPCPNQRETWNTPRQLEPSPPIIPGQSYHHHFHYHTRRPKNHFTSYNFRAFITTTLNFESISLLSSHFKSTLFYKSTSFKQPPKCRQISGTSASMPSSSPATPLKLNLWMRLSWTTLLQLRIELKLLSRTHANLHGSIAPSTLLVLPHRCLFTVVIPTSSTDPRRTLGEKRHRYTMLTKI